MVMIRKRFRRRLESFPGLDVRAFLLQFHFILYRYLYPRTLFYIHCFVSRWRERDYLKKDYNNIKQRPKGKKEVFNCSYKFSPLKSTVDSYLYPLNFSITSSTVRCLFIILLGANFSHFIRNMELVGVLKYITW